MFSQDTKRLLKNYIRHTDTHNRIQEENDMWKQYEKIKNEETKKYSSNKSSLLDDRRDDMNHDRYRMKSRSAHMDDRDMTSTASTYWTRQLEKIESADPERWGHSGFKELYPKDFDSDRSEQDSSLSSSSSDDRNRRKRRKKKKKKKKEEMEWVESKPPKNNDNNNSELKRKKSKKRKTVKEDLSDSSESEKYIPPKRLKKHKNKQHKKKKKHKHRD